MIGPELHAENAEICSGVVITQRLFLYSQDSLCQLWSDNMATKDMITHLTEDTDTAVAKAIGATFVQVDVK